MSEECKDLIRKLLVTDPKKRLTASQALKHEWFTKNRATASTVEISDEVIRNLSDF